MQPLPIDPLVPEILDALRRSSAVVLEAAPGAGKTTRVPPALLALGRGHVIVSEPRRLPARLAATRVASERQEQVGHTVGYSVRFDEAVGPATRLVYVTEGVLLRRLLRDPQLLGVDAVVLDEFHERHLASDLCLALLNRLQTTVRPELKLVVMSATLDAEPVARFLAGAVRVQSAGRMFPVEIEHAPKPDERPLEKRVVSAVKDLLRAEHAGDILVFLPGAAEIRRSSEALSELAQGTGTLVVPLHGDLPIEAQARAVSPADRRKVVLSTNVAESSVTIEGVTAVVDSGLARVATVSPWTGLPALTLAKISRAAAVQRAGRAGRTAPGRVLRLYLRSDFESRPRHDAPEIERLDLSEAMLILHGSGVSDPRSLAWLSPPPEAALDAAENLLRRVGALNTDGRLSAIGRRLLEFPVHPRLGRVLVEAERRGIPRRGCLAVALLSEREIRSRSRADFGAGRQAIDASGPSDILELFERFGEAENARFRSSALRAANLDPGAVAAVDQTRKQLQRIARAAGEMPDTEAETEAALGLALLSGFSDRVAKRKRSGTRELVLCTGTSANLSEQSVVHQAALMVALDAEQHKGQTVVRLASAIEPEWLLEFAADDVQERTELVWNEQTARVERILRTTYGSFTLEEQRSAAPASPEATDLLVRELIGKRAPALADRLDAIDRVKVKLQLAREHMPDLGWPELDSAQIEALLTRELGGMTTLEELRAVDLAGALVRAVSAQAPELLARELPEKLRLPSGRELKVHYEPGKPPWVESRLQDFFGMASLPALCRGRLPLTVHLLAPSQRAVQVTSDLAGFWQRHYPSIRKELMRQYPRHAWPEDGRTASPPAPRPPRKT